MGGGPTELEGIQMYIDPWGLQEALAHPNGPLNDVDIKLPRKGLGSGKWRKASGVGYEVWAEVLKTSEGFFFFNGAFTNFCAIARYLRREA